MSGVYIKGVEIPAEGVLCIDIFPDGRVAGHYDCTIKQAKAVPVPDHGRLIDIELEDCPFCGGIARIFVSDGVCVKCTQCGCQTPVKIDTCGEWWENGKSNALEWVIKKWNRRVK